MGIPRFFLPPGMLTTGDGLLDEKDSRHAILVLRLQAGDAVRLIDGEGRERSGVVVGPEGKRLRVQVDVNSGVSASASPGPAMHLFISVIRPERMEWLVQKACELGVRKIVPVITQRTIVKLSAERWEGKTARWERIAKESCKQCGLSLIPEILPVLPLDKALKKLPPAMLEIVPTLSLPGRGLADTLRGGPTTPLNISIYIGPEGDFTSEEVGQLVARGAQPVTLGELVLRSETAALYALSAVRHHFSS